MQKTKPITESDIQDLRALLDKVTPGPWVSFVEGRDHESGSSFIRTGPDGARTEDIELSGAPPADQDFIARAREDVPRLLAEIERLHALARAALTAAE